jgi:hypothetical protein
VTAGWARFRGARHAGRGSRAAAQVARKDHTSTVVALGLAASFHGAHVAVAGRRVVPERGNVSTTFPTGMYGVIRLHAVPHALRPPGEAGAAVGGARGAAALGGESGGGAGGMVGRGAEMVRAAIEQEQGRIRAEAARFIEVRPAPPRPCAGSARCAWSDCG